MKRSLLLLIVPPALLGLLVGMLLAPQPDDTLSDTLIAEAVALALEAQMTALARQAPVLISPAEGTRFDNLAAARLEWEWMRPLEHDEFYDVRVWSPGEPPYGITWTKDTAFDLRDWLLDQSASEFQWTVAVVKPVEAGEPPLEVTDAAPPITFRTDNAVLDLLELPDGFSAQLAARFPFSQPTVVTFAPSGDLYALGADGVLARMIDADGDGYYESHQIVYANSEGELLHSVGLAFWEDGVYISHAGRVSVFRDEDGDGVLDSSTVLVDGLPTWEQVFHSNNGIAFGPDGRLYIAVGSTTDHGPLRHPLEAAILRMNPDGSALEIYATGLRNPYDLTFSPTGDLFTADNSPDEMDERLPYLPPEELNFIREGRNYGFPDAFGFAGARATQTEPPVTEFYTSVASAGLTYYAGDLYPPEYHGIYVAQFGTGAPFPESRGVQSGREVVHVALEPDGDGGFTGRWQTFARMRTELGNFSPIDVTVGPDGSLYIAEWITSTLFRIVYDGEVAPMVAILAMDSTLTALGEQLYHEGAEDAPACSACHSITTNAAGIGPSLRGIAAVAGGRVGGLDAREYLRQSIIEPSAYIVSGYQPGVMYSGYGDALSENEIEALVAYILAASGG